MLRLVRGFGHREHVKLSRLLFARRELVTLAIETSCDDTAVAVLEKDGPRARLHFNEKITANNLAHGGIHPLVALESHQENLAALVRTAAQHVPPNGSKQWRRIPDFVSVTRGPGMRSNLAIGIDTAKGLAVAWDVPIIGVHHMQAHALTPRLVDALCRDPDQGLERRVAPNFPFLSLLVSGGHTLLIRSMDIAEHKILATTTNNAIGDCLDKAARAVLPPSVLAAAPSTSYGPLLESFAFPRGAQDYAYTAPRTRGEELANSQRPSPYGWPMPAPFLNSNPTATASQFSFAGNISYVLSVAARGWDPARNKLNLAPRASPMPEAEARHLARETQRVCFEHLASRAALALQNDPDVRHCSTLVLAGGVAANGFLRHVVGAYLAARGFGDVEIVAPPVRFCTDNAAMIAWTAAEMYEAGLARDDLRFRAFRKWSLENLLAPDREEESKSVAESGLDMDRLRAKSEGVGDEELA